jgi:hypothetical protein
MKTWPTAPVLVDVDMGTQTSRSPLQAGPSRQDACGQVRDLPGDGQYLHTIAGGQGQTLAHRTVLQKPLFEALHAGQGELFAHLHGGGAVVESEENDLLVHAVRSGR